MRPFDCRIIHMSFRTPTHPEGIPNLQGKDKALIEEHNLIAANMFKLCAIAHKHNVIVSIENPGRSMLWRTKLFCEWADLTSATKVSLDYCRFGLHYRKNTAFWVTSDKFAPLALSCNHEKGTHMIVSGWFDLKDPSRHVVRTAQVAAYPKRLCTKWAKIAVGVCLNDKV